MLEDSGLRGLEKVLSDFVEIEKGYKITRKPFNSFMYIDGNGALRRRENGETVISCSAEDQDNEPHYFELKTLQNAIFMDKEVVKKL